MQGYISIQRAIQKHWIFQDANYLKWWLSILMNVNHSQTKFPVNNELCICNPGESFRSIDGWTALFGCSKKTTIKFFSLLEKDGIIERKILGRGNRRKHLLTVVNWTKYQNLETKTTPKGNRNVHRKVPPNNNDNKDNNERVEKNSRFSPPTFFEIQKYFTEKLIEKDIQINPNSEAEKFESFYSSKNWMVGKNKMVDWKKSVSGWIARINIEKQTNGNYFKEKAYEAL